MNFDDPVDKMMNEVRELLGRDLTKQQEIIVRQIAEYKMFSDSMITMVEMIQASDEWASKNALKMLTFMYKDDTKSAHKLADIMLNILGDLNTQCRKLSATCEILIGAQYTRNPDAVDCTGCENCSKALICRNLDGKGGDHEAT